MLVQLGKLLDFKNWDYGFLQFWWPLQFWSSSYFDHFLVLKHYLRAILCKNQTKWEMKNFDPPTQIYMEIGLQEGCSKMSIIEVIT